MKAIDIEKIHLPIHRYDSITNNVVTAEEFINSYSFKFHLGLHWLCFYYIKKAK